MTGRPWFLLGECCAKGLGLDRDLRRAEELYCRAAELGDPDAAKALKGLRASAAREPGEARKKGGLKGLLDKFRGK